MERLIPQLACPRCHGVLTEQAEMFSCTACTAHYPIKDGKIYFIESMHAEDSLDLIKNRLKRYLGQAYYKIGVTVFAPSYPFNYRRAIRKHVDPSAEIVVDLGSGNNRIDRDIVTVDATDYGAVDIVATLEALPFKDNAVDALCSRSVLEHVPDIDLTLAELSRCTRTGGLGIHFVPFMFPFHASPYDFRRWTHVGAAKLLTGWHFIEQKSTAGPISLFLVCLLEFLSALVSCGNQRVKAAAYLFFCLFLFPLKLLDAPFVGRPMFLGLAPTLLTVLRKP